MTTRCKDGDIAIVINEPPLCAGNLGRFVHVRGPYQYIDILGFHGWVIKPVNNQKMWVQLRRDPPKVVFDRVYWNNPRCLPDAWLLWHSPKSVDKFGTKTKMVKCKCGEQNALAPTDA